MRIAYTTIFNAEDVHNWSGTPYYMSKAFAANGFTVDYIGSLQRKLPPFFKMKQVWNKYIAGKRESPRFNIYAAQQYAWQISQRLAGRPPYDMIVSPLVTPIAFLDCKEPIVLWTDSLYSALVGFYSPFSTHSADTVAQGNVLTAACLSRVRLAIFSSEWAANSAIELYGADRQKVKVVPFGANLDDAPTEDDVRAMIKNRLGTPTIKLLFLAKSWERKGGDIVLAVAKKLHEAGHPVELTIVGYTPPNLDPIPPYIKAIGFISKHTVEGKNKIRQLLAETHFLFVPSRAEAYGIVFCEANAFAVPCLTTYVGGIATVVKDHVNGMTFALDAPSEVYCEYILTLMHSRLRYETLALSAYHEYQTRLNWQVATQQVKALLAEC